MTFDQLTQIALLGTDRAGWTAADSDDAVLAAALKTCQQKGSLEDQLLMASALMSAYETCGAITAETALAPSAVAAVDQRPVCSRKAADVLEGILALSNTSTKHDLVNEWLLSAACASQRLPHTLLPVMLDYGAAKREAWPAVAAVLGERGHWLMEQNPRWQFAASDGENIDDAWSTGNRERRVSALERVRRIDPVRGLRLVESTWKEDGADERAVFIETMRFGLTLADEPFLESALDDRSKQVRAAAAELLCGLAGSALVGRMLARVEALISFKPKIAGGFLRKGTSAQIEVELPPDQFDPAWARDGIIEKPTGRVGRRQWWLQQMVAAVPPAHWSHKWNLQPGNCIAALHGDHASLLTAGWTKAAQRYHDVEWLQALLFDSLREGHGPPQFGLLQELPSGQQRLILPQLLKPKIDIASLTQILNALHCDLDEQTAGILLNATEQQLTVTGANSNYAFGNVLEPLAKILPPNLHDDLSRRWIGPVWDANRKSVDAFFQTLQMRHKIKTEFAQ